MDILGAVENLFDEINNSWSAYMRQAGAVDGNIQALTPSDMGEGTRARAVRQAVFAGTEGIASGPEYIRKKISMLREAMDKLTRYMESKPKPTITVKILPVTRSHEPELPAVHSSPEAESSFSGFDRR